MKQLLNFLNPSESFLSSSINLIALFSLRLLRAKVQPQEDLHEPPHDSHWRAASRLRILPPSFYSGKFNLTLNLNYSFSKSTYCTDDCVQAARVQSSRNRDTEGRRREEVLRWAAKGSRASRGARQEDGGEGKEAEAFAFFKSSALPPPASATTAIAAATPTPTARQLWPPCDNLGAYTMKMYKRSLINHMIMCNRNTYCLHTYKPGNLYSLINSNDP